MTGVSICLVMIGLVAIQPDLGNAAIIVLTTVVMFSISGVGYRWFTALFARYCRDFVGLPRLNCLGWGSNHG